jgi:hypothetical protein
MIRFCKIYANTRPSVLIRYYFAQDGFFGDAQNEANLRQPDFDQEHLERHHDLLFRGPQVKENGSRVSENVPSHWLQRKMRRFPFCVR